MHTSFLFYLLPTQHTMGHQEQDPGARQDEQC